MNKPKAAASRLRKATFKPLKIDLKRRLGWPPFTWRPHLASRSQRFEVMQRESTISWLLYIAAQYIPKSNHFYRRQNATTLLWFTSLVGPTEAQTEMVFSLFRVPVFRIAPTRLEGGYLVLVALSLKEHVDCTPRAVQCTRNPSYGIRES